LATSWPLRDLGRLIHELVAPVPEQVLRLSVHQRDPPAGPRARWRPGIASRARLQPPAWYDHAGLAPEDRR
jgi:hypothetical protein